MIDYPQANAPNTQYDSTEPPDEGGFFIDPFTDEAEYREIVGKLTTEISAASNAKSAHDTITDDLRAILELRVPKREPAFPGGANYRTPLIQNKIFKVADLLTAALDVDPFFGVRARTADAEEIRLALEEFIDLRVDEIDIRSHISTMLVETLLLGASVTKVYYEQLGTGSSAIRRNRLDLVPIEDFLVSPLTVSKLEDAYLVAQRFWMPRWKLEQWAQDGVIQGDVSKLNQATSTPAAVSHELAGNQTTSSTANNGSDLIELYECWWQHESGMCCTWFHDGSQTILKHEPNPFQHGRAPFVIHKIRSKPNFLYGFSLGETLLPTQLEMDATRNARMDAVSMGIGGVYTVEQGSVEEKHLKDNPIQPGAWIPTENIQNPKIRPMEMARASDQIFQDINMLYNDADRATVPDTNIGGGALISRSNITATETQRDMDITNNILKSWLHSIHAGLRDLAYLLVHNLQQYEVRNATVIDPMNPMQPMSGVLEFFSGTNKRSIKADDMFLESIDIEVNGRETKTMQAERQQKSTLVLKMFQEFVQMGVFQPGQPIADHRIYTGLKNMLLAYDVKDWEAYLGPEPMKLEVSQAIATMQALQNHMQQQTGGANAPSVPTQTSTTGN